MSTPMDLAHLQSFLGWCTVINYGFLLVWFFVLLLASNWIIGIHSRWFDMEPASVRVEHYHLMGQFKLLILVFNFAPWLALVLMAR